MWVEFSLYFVLSFCLSFRTEIKGLKARVITPLRLGRSSPISTRLGLRANMPKDHWVKLDGSPGQEIVFSLDRLKLRLSWKAH